MNKKLSGLGANFKLVLFIQLAPIIILSAVTFSYLEKELWIMYFLMSAMFCLSSYRTLKYLAETGLGVFTYLINLLLMLGFWLKFSVQKIFPTEYREPIGRFVFNSKNESQVLWITTIAILALVISHFFQERLNKKLNTLKKERSFTTSKKWFILAIIFFLTLAFSFINLKFNILLFSLKPSITLPFKGNVIFFLLLTRILIFCFFFYCLEKFDLKMIFFGALISAVSSIGVLSRLGPLLYFFAVFIFLFSVMRDWSLKKFTVNIFVCSIVFIFSSYLAVLGGTGMREIFIEKAQHKSKQEITPQSSQVVATEPSPAPQTVSAQPELLLPKASKHNFNFSEKLKIYKELALGRWIGIEGLMAVYAYPNKSFSLFMDALKETNYTGNSFYDKIAKTNSNIDESSNTISTSVPGPIAFFYYTGSLTFVFLAIFCSNIFFSSIEKLIFSLYGTKSAAAIFISCFVAFDYYQFGIAPMAFVKYFGFSLFSVLAFYFCVYTLSAEGKK